MPTKTIHSPLNLRDPSGTLRRDAARLARHSGTTDVAGNIRFAVAHTLSALHIALTPLNYTLCNDALLVDLIIHGDGPHVRQSAWDEIERRRKTITR